MTDPQLVMIDGREALAAVLIMPNGDGDGVEIHAHANGMTREEAAYVLRHVSESWCPEDSEMARLQVSEQLLIHQVEATVRYAQAQVVVAKANGRDDRAWLDLIILLEAAS